MGSKAVKVSDAAYAFLKKTAEEQGTSIKEVVDRMASERDIFDYAGSWEMSEEEQEAIRESRSELWDEWEP